jgi:hypothetical protein
MTLIVHAHWTDAPVGSKPSVAPFPSSFATYPGGQNPPTIGDPRSGGSPPPWPGIYQVWCEIASQTDIYAANWNGPGFPGFGKMQSPADEGYSPSAFGFSVTGAGIRLASSGLPVSAGLTFTLWDPNGNQVGVATATGGSGPFPFSPTVNVPIGQGIWTVTVTPTPGSPASEPQALLGPSPVDQPYVTVFGTDIDVEVVFSGTEITCPDQVTSSATIATDCEKGTRAATLTITLSSSGSPLLLPPGSIIEWSWGDGQSAGNTPVTTAGSTFSISHSYSPGTYTPTVTLIIGETICGPYYFNQITVPPCFPCPNSVTVVVVTPPGVTGCVPGGNPAATLQASVNWPATGGPYPSPTGYDWEITLPQSGGDATKSTLVTNSPTVTTDLASGWSGAGANAGAVNLSSPGMYSVAVTAKFAASSGIPDACNLLGSTTFTVPECNPCPKIETPVARVSGCVGPGNAASVSFDTSILSGPPATSFGWIVTNASGTSFTKTTSVPTTTSGVADGTWLDTANGSSGQVDLSTAGPCAVTVSASGPTIATGCPPSAPSGFTIPSCPPKQNGGGSGGSLGCSVLLVIAVVSMLLGAVLVVIGICLAVSWLGITGAITAGVGLALFVIWSIFCAAFTSLRPNALRTVSTCVDCRGSGSGGGRSMLSVWQRGMRKCRGRKLGRMGDYPRLAGNDYACGSL